ncbi:hydrogenase maturation protease [Sulfurimonas paralvinellae]|uniref:Hydrogenase maturation protease n=1 Tax=Sulfurimonas paralvinellae TaxID=317658 RepID=A0A7M1BAS2_9BACT|nr:hydrogenase maturation protease [Sulfurimonas paralvinellae]QOP46793.1 hydrogenase maturation protease [Sulfurimonas paralvinellae]
MEKKVALIGSGNAFFKDEGIGLYGAKYLKENYKFSPAIDIVDGGTLGFKLMPLIQEYDEVIIINTASDDTKEVGDITIKTTEEFLNGDLIKKTANEVEIAEMLQICSLTEQMAETIVISIVPEDIIAVEVGLTQSLRAVWSVYIETIIEKIENLGIKIEKKDNYVSLEEILEIFANPSIEHSRGF